MIARHRPRPPRRAPLLCALLLFTSAAWAGPYGKDISGRWDAGAKLEAKGDYANAAKQYEQALAAARKLIRKDLDKKQLDTLRACAILGSEARLAGARAGVAAIRADSSAAGKRMAAAKAEQAFQIANEEADRKRPDLASACP